MHVITVYSKFQKVNVKLNAGHSHSCMLMYFLLLHSEPTLISQSRSIKHLVMLVSSLGLQRLSFAHLVHVMTIPPLCFSVIQILTSCYFIQNLL